MRIKLIQPRMTQRPMDTILKTRMAPSLALLTLATLTPPKHQLTIEDENVKPLTLNDRPDLVAITTNVDTSLRAYAISQSYRARGIPVVGGGIHVSAVPNEARQHFDAVCIGPAEPVWAAILADAETQHLQAVYRSEGPLSGSLIPLLNRDLVPPGHYLYTNIIAGSRGCPHKCSFCYNSCAYVDNATVNRPVEDVVQEIKSLPTRHVMFIDDNFIGNLAWARQLLTAFRRERLDLKWNAAVTTNIVHHPDLLDLMAATGCNSLFIGFESISPEANGAVGKRHNKVETYDALIAAIHERGIMVNASLVFGLDHDDAGVFERTLRWLVTNKVETMTAHILTPYPGTVLHHKLECEGRIVDRNYERYNTSHVVFKPSHMTPEQLQAGYLWMYSKLYSWGNIFRRMPKAHQQVVPYLLFNLFYRKYGRFTARLAHVGLLTGVGRLARRLSYHVG